jgi:MFS family permease
LRNGLNNAAYMTPFITLVLASFLARFGYQMARSPVLPRFAQDLGAAPEAIGLIVAASTISGVVIKLPAGALSDVLGRKRMMLLGCHFFAAPPFLYPFVHSPGALLALRFLHGFATAIFSPVASAFVADLSVRGRGQKLGWFASANDLGGTVGPLLGVLLLFFTASYSMTFLAVGVLGLLPLAIILRLPEDRTPRPASSTLGASSRRFWSGIREVASSRAVVIASVLEAALYVGYGGFPRLLSSVCSGDRAQRRPDQPSPGSPDPGGPLPLRPDAPHRSRAHFNLASLPGLSALRTGGWHRHPFDHGPRG